MSQHLSCTHRMPAALFVALVATCASAQTTPAKRMVMEPTPGVQVSYELVTENDAAAPERIDGTVATPHGTLRTSVRTVANEERSLQRGDTSFELSDSVLGGKVQVRELEAGGSGLAWRAPLGDGLAARIQGERTSIRSEEGLQLQQDLGGGDSAKALMSNSRTATAQGSRWDLELAMATGDSRWSAGIEAAEHSYVSALGELAPRTGVRLGTQWRLSPQSRTELRYTRQAVWYAEEPISTVMLSTRFDLSKRASLVTAVETDADARSKAWLKLTVPLEPR